MKRYFMLFNIVCLFWLQSIWASPDDAFLQRIEAVVPANFSGQIVISDADRILYSGSFGFADREAELPVTEKTLFDIGSITKTYTATAVLLLAAQEKLRLDMTLSDWFEGLPEITGSITLHQVLSHTSGLPQYSGDDDDSCDRGCFDRWLAKASLEFSPGDRFLYSNPGYSALARIIEKVSGQSYEIFINEALVGPLNAGPVGYLQHAERSEGVWYGYGWSILQKPWGEVIDHTGGNGFFFADARWFRDRGLLLTITNNAFDREQVQALLNDIRAALELVE